MAESLLASSAKTTTLAVGRRAPTISTMCSVLVFVSSCVAGGLSIYAPSPPDQPPEYCTVFNHMVKSGGTSIKTQLEQSSEVEGDAFPGLCTYGGEFSTPDLCLRALHNSSVITGYGELLRDPLAKEGRSCDFFTMMRHPVSRLVSAFYFCPDDPRLRGRPARLCGNLESEIPMAERLMEFARRTIWARVGFAEMLYALRCPPGFALCDPDVTPIKHLKDSHSEEGRDALVRMQENLRSYKAVGIFEHWELSMRLFDATVTSSVRQWDQDVVLNPGIKNPERQKVLEWAYESPELHRALATDVLLYQYCLSMFKHQTAKVLGTIW